MLTPVVFRLLTHSQPRKNQDSQAHVDDPPEATPDLWETLATLPGPMPAPNDDPNTSYLNYFPLASGGGSIASSPTGGRGEIDVNRMFSFGDGNDPSAFLSGTSDLNVLEGQFYGASGDWFTFDGGQVSSFI